MSGQEGVNLLSPASVLSHRDFVIYCCSFSPLTVLLLFLFVVVVFVGFLALSL